MTNLNHVLHTILYYLDIRMYAYVQCDTPCPCVFHLQPLTPCGFDEVVLVCAIGHSYGDYGRD